MLCLGFAVLAACNSGYSSGVEGSKPFSTITESEARTACDNLRDYFESQFPDEQRIETACYVSALSDVTAGPEECEAAYNACRAETTTAEPIDIDCSMPMIDETCNATVSQVETCLNAIIDAQLERQAMIDCSVAGNIPELERLAEQLPTPSECSSIESICPNIPGT